MRPLLLLILLLFCAPLVNAQILIPGSESAPELKIVGAGWEQSGGDMVSHISFSDPVSMSVSQAAASGSASGVLNASGNGTTVVAGRSSTVWRISPKRNPVNCKALLWIENTSAKTIRAFYADYVFIDPQTGGEFLRYQFREKTKISPGKSKRMNQYIYQKVGKNRKFFSLAKPGADLLMRIGRAYFKVVVTRVEYTDGTAWQRS